MADTDRIGARTYLRLPQVLADADRLIARDVDGHVVALPTAVVPPADPARYEGVAHLARLHNRDRPHVARAWVNAIAEPGRVFSTKSWTKVGTDWKYYQYDYCSYLDHPDVGAVLMGVTELPPDTSPPETSTASGSRDAVLWSVLSVGPFGSILRAEGTVEELYGRTADELVGTNGLDLIHPDDHERLLEAWTEVNQGDATLRAVRQRVVSATGQITWVLASIGRPDAEGAVTIHDLDISAQLAAEEALRSSEARFRQLASDLPAGVFVADGEGWFEFTNSRCASLVGDWKSLGEILEPTNLDWAAVVREASSSGEAEFRRDFDDGRILRFRCQRPMPDGTVFGVVDDVTTSTRWREAATKDPLTGLANRSTLTQGIARRIESGRRSLVAFIDLDGFKRVNDEHGHDEGDRVLVEVGAALRGMIRDGDLAGRWGGDEFVLLVGDLPPDARSDLRRRIDASMVTCGAGGASVGFTTIQPDDEVGDVMTRADLAMYAEKRGSTA